MQENLFPWQCFFTGTDNDLTPTPIYIYIPIYHQPTLQLSSTFLFEDNIFWETKNKNKNKNKSYLRRHHLY